MTILYLKCIPEFLVDVPAVGFGFPFRFVGIWVLLLLYVWIFDFLFVGSNATDERLLLEMYIYQTYIFHVYLTNFVFFFNWVGWRIINLVFGRYCAKKDLMTIYSISGKTDFSWFFFGVVFIGPDCQNFLDLKLEF